MTTLDANSLQILTLSLVGAVILVLVLVLLVFLRLLNRFSGSSMPTATSTGTFCGNCGSPIANDPRGEISLGAKSYLVYECKQCKGETLLPAQVIRLNRR